MKLPRPKSLIHGVPLAVVLFACAPGAIVMRPTQTWSARSQIGVSPEQKESSVQPTQTFGTGVVQQAGVAPPQWPSTRQRSTGTLVGPVPMGGVEGK